MRYIPIFFPFVLLICLCQNSTQQRALDPRFVTYTVHPKEKALDLYYQDIEGNRFGSIENLRDWLGKQGKALEFAMNAGMFNPDFQPTGLFVQNRSTIRPINRDTGIGNFYLLPNGIFYLDTAKNAFISKTEVFDTKASVLWATQSGPMLVIEGAIHPKFKQGSTHLNIRNGVGILPDGKVVFAMSKEKVNFHDFATFFQQMGCKNALYLDGFVSRTYLPEQNWVQLDGDFGVMVGVVR